MSRVLIGNLPPGTTIRNIDDFCSPYGRLLYVDVKNQGDAMMACVELENPRNALNLVRARHGYNFNGYNIQLKIMDDSSPYEVRDGPRQRNLSPTPVWSNNRQSNSQMFSNGMMQGQSSFGYDNNRGGNYYNDNSYNSNCGPSSMDNSSLDFNEACRIVFDRFLREGYNRQVAKEKTLEFVTNMQRGGNLGFDSFNTNYSVPDQDFMNSNSNFGNNGNQNWGGNNFFDGENQQMFSKSSWGNFNGPRDQQMASGWGGARGRNVGSTPYPMGSGNNSGRPMRGGYRDETPSTSGRIIGGNRNDFGPARIGARNNTAPNVADVSFRQELYAKSLIIRNKIEAKIKSGTSTPRDLKNFQFHTKIIDDYEQNYRPARKFVKPVPADEHQKFQRYKSALGIVLKYKKSNKSQLTDEELRLYNSNKAIVDEYEQPIKNKGIQTAVAKFERAKNELIKRAKKDYPFKFVLSGAARKKKFLLVEAGIDKEEARFIALHSSSVVNDLIELKKALPKKENKSKQLVLYNAAGARPQTAKINKQNATNKPKPVAPTKASEPEKTAAEILAKKLKAGCRSARKVLLKHEKSDLDKLTDKEKAIIRISLRRLRSYNQAEGKPIETTRFDVLLKDDPKDKTSNTEDNKEEDDREKEANENGEEDGEADAEANGEADAEEDGGEEANVEECLEEHNPEEEEDWDEEEGAQDEQRTEE